MYGHGAFLDRCSVFHFWSSCQVGIGKGHSQNWEVTCSPRVLE